MKLKKYLALLCAVAMLLVLVSCGGQGVQTVTPDANDPQIEGNEAADPAVTGEDNESGAAPAVPKTGDPLFFVILSYRKMSRSTWAIITRRNILNG